MNQFLTTENYCQYCKNNTKSQQYAHFVENHDCVGKAYHHSDNTYFIYECKYCTEISVKQEMN